jgi:predicted dehydrogenase/threonine dehydrogenase-like Zn-dependent dehydrogenase
VDAEFPRWFAGSREYGFNASGNSMKQLLQSARTGKLEVTDVPAPGVRPGCVLVRIARSLVSAGTERAVFEFASKSVLQKAHSRPDLVLDVLNKVRRDGLLSTLNAVRGRLDQPLEPGYSSAGTIVEVGGGIVDLKLGDRVACAGAGFAVHAEFALVPRMLVARIPRPEVDFESAAFTTLGSVAIHAVRTAEAQLGGLVAVIGLGLLGQLTVQILQAAGCRVVGIDLLPERAELACRMGAIAAAISEADFREICSQRSSGYGADAVLITAETASSEPVNLAATVCRDRGIVVAVGTVGMDLQRKLYYEKEIDFRVSRSYGPGRYDAAYEQKGSDYPIGHVRWTENRNMQAFLQLLADGKLDLAPLITHRFSITESVAAYDLISGRRGKPYLGVLIEYPNVEKSESNRLELIPRFRSMQRQERARVGVLGAGNFVQSILLPAIKREPGTELIAICASNGARSRSCAGKFGFTYCTSSSEEVFSNPEINTVVIATRHYLHTPQVLRALECGKHVVCEKPLCLTEDELLAIEDMYGRTASSCRLMVGFNRRFAPFVQRMKTFLAKNTGPITMYYRVNAGPLPADHWINDPDQGGGRVLGEMCHFVDLLSFLCGSSPASVRAQGLLGVGGQDVIASVEFENGSLGTISYNCNGDRTFAKERIEIFGDGCVAVLDDFRRLELVRNGKKKSLRSWLGQDKGHAAEWRAFSECIRSGGPAPIQFEEIMASTLATIRIAESLRSGRAITANFRVQEEEVAPLVS